MANRVRVGVVAAFLRRGAGLAHELIDPRHCRAHGPDDIAADDQDPVLRWSPTKWRAEDRLMRSSLEVLEPAFAAETTVARCHPDRWS